MLSTMSRDFLMAALRQGKPLGVVGAKVALELIDELEARVIELEAEGKAKMGFKHSGGMGTGGLKLSRGFKAHFVICGIAGLVFSGVMVWAIIKVVIAFVRVTS